MTQRLVWEHDGRQWPHREASRFVAAGGLRWHVQSFPAEGRPRAQVLLLHGTGAATHSWRGLAPLLQARGFSLLAMDLPGHGFTDMPAGGTASRLLSLQGMAAAVAELLRRQEFAPTVLVGHSAGAAIALELCLSGAVDARAVCGINAALLPLGGLPGQVFSPLAKLMAAAPLVPRLFTWRAGDPAVIRRLIDGTGSRLDDEGLALYGQLVRNPGHAEGALGMMAHWDLPALARRLGQVRTPLHLLVGSHDRTVPPRDAHRVVERLPADVRRPVRVLPGLGHLAHEEDPAAVAAWIDEAHAREAGAGHPQG